MDPFLTTKVDRQFSRLVQLIGEFDGPEPATAAQHSADRDTPLAVQVEHRVGQETAAAALPLLKVGGEFQAVFVHRYRLPLPMHRISIRHDLGAALVVWADAGPGGLVTDPPRRFGPGGEAHA